MTIPAADPGATKAPRKVVSGLDETQRGGFQLLGAWLDAGAVYELATNTIVFGNDRTSDASRVRIWRVLRDGTLKTERDTTFAVYASTYGKSVIGTLRTKLTKYPPARTAPRQVRPGPPQPNTRDGWCRICRQPVPAGAGVLVRSPQRIEVQHASGCPPTRTMYAQSCHWCAGWMEAGEGIVLSTPGVYPLLFGAHGMSDDDCPPPQQRKAQPPTVNDYDGECDRCHRTVHAGDGFYDRRTRTARHRDGQCPEPDQPLWRIQYGSPGRLQSRPASGYRPGEVRRETLHESEHPVPTTAPGYRGVRDEAVSALVVVVDELPPVYCRDADGDQPAGLIGQDGWLFRAHARIATEPEAADVLAAETKQQHRADLDQRRQSLLAWRYAHSDGPATDADRPVVDHGALTARTVDVPFQDRIVTASNSSAPPDELRVDEAAGEVWTLIHNGADGDDWSASNVGRYIGWRHPLTPQRRQLVDDLRAEYGHIEPATDGDGPAT